LTISQFHEALENAGFVLVARKRFFFGIAHGLTARCQ
jgi:hypothetical protein